MSRSWYFEALVDLPRQWRENPLVALGHPRRRSIFHRAIALLILLLVGMAAVMAGCTLLTGNVLAYVPGGRALGGAAVLAVGSAPVLMLPIFLIYSPIWRQTERLVDIRLTRLTPREVAVGALFWPIVMAGLVGLVGALALAATLFSSMNDGSRYVIAPASVGTYAFALINLLAVGSRLWLSKPDMGWRLVLIAPLRSMPASFGFFLFLFVGAQFLWSALRWDRSPEAFIGSVIVCGLAIASGVWYQWIYLRLAFRDAGTRVMGLIDRDALLRVCWTSREAAAGRLPRAARGAMGPLLRHWVGRLPAVLGAGVVIFGGLLLLCFMVPDLHPIRSRPDDRIGLWLIIFHWGTVVYGVALSWLARREGRVPLLSGRFGLSVLLWLPTGMVTAVGVLAVLVFGDQSSINRNQPLSWVPYLIALVLFTVAVGMFALAYLVWVASSPRPARTRVLLLVVHTVLGLLVFWAIDRSSEALSIVVGMSYALAGLLPMLLLPWALDRLHRRELTDIPIGRSNIDTAPNPDAAIIPDEMAAG